MLRMELSGERKWGRPKRRFMDAAVASRRTRGGGGGGGGP